MQGKLLNTTKSLWYPGYKKWCTFPFGGGGGGGGGGSGGGGGGGGGGSGGGGGGVY